MYLRKCVSCGKQSNKFNFIRINKVKDKFVDNKKISEMEFPSPLSGVGK